MQSWLLSIPIAHRGLHDESEAPENTVASFQNAIEANIPIELDIQSTSDGKIIVFHDENLLRLTGLNLEVNNSEWREIKDLTISESKEHIPLFEELLELINGRVPLLIEIKNNGKPGRIEEKVLDKMSNYKGELAIQSFNPYSVNWFKKNAPEITRGIISSKFKDDSPSLNKFLLKNLLLNFLLKPDFINYNIDDLPFFPVEYFRKKGLPILAWTVKSEKQLTKARKLCNNFVFEKLLPEQVLS